MRYFQAGFTSEDRQVLYGLAASLQTIQQTLRKIMSEDAAVAAAAAQLTTDAASIATALTALQAIVAALQAEVNANPNVVQPATIQALADAQAAVDAVTATAGADVTADTPPAP